MSELIFSEKMQSYGAVKDFLTINSVADILSANCLLEFKSDKIYHPINDRLEFSVIDHIPAYTIHSSSFFQFFNRTTLWSSYLLFFFEGKTGCIKTKVDENIIMTIKHTK